MSLTCSPLSHPDEGPWFRNLMRCHYTEKKSSGSSYISTFSALIKTDDGHYEGIYFHLTVDDYFSDIFSIRKKKKTLKFICARNTERKFSHSETCAFSNLSLKRFSVNTRQEQGKSRLFLTKKQKSVLNLDDRAKHSCILLLVRTCTIAYLFMIALVLHYLAVVRHPLSTTPFVPATHRSNTLLRKFFKVATE